MTDRERIVSWLRRKASMARIKARNAHNPRDFMRLDMQARAYDDIADAIERGEHEEKKDGR